MRIVATVSTLRFWRHKGTGPRYFKRGNRILYRGADVNSWIDLHMVETAA